MWRRFLDRAFRALAIASALVIGALFIVIVLFIFGKALPALSINFLFSETRAAGASGGVVFQVIGTLVLVLCSLVVGLPIAVSLALVDEWYLRCSRYRGGISLVLFVLNGTPPVVFGIFGMIFFSRWLGWGKSWLAGGILLGLLITPVMTAAAVEGLRKLSVMHLDAALSLGLNSEQVVSALILPRALAGAVSGCFLGLARVSGETALVMLTAAVFYGASVPRGVRDSPVLTLSYHVFVLSQDTLDPSVEARLWASALVLLGLVLLFGVLSTALRTFVLQSWQ